MGSGWDAALLLLLLLLLPPFQCCSRANRYAAVVVVGLSIGDRRREKTVRRTFCGLGFFPFFVGFFFVFATRFLSLLFLLR